MRLHEIIEQSTNLRCECAEDPEITMVCADSRKVGHGALFIAIHGYKDDGLKYIHDALKRGARAVVVEQKAVQELKNMRDVAVCSTPDTRKCALDVSRIFYRHPSKSFRLIGVTGTNGKTTVTYLIEAILRQGGKTPGVLGTISHRYDNVVKKADNTTPDPVLIQSLFSDMREAGVSDVVMEVSSHALVMKRACPEDFDIALFTNLSQDHLDFHITMEDYFKAKALLFSGLKDSAHAVVNQDDPYGKKIVSLTRAEVKTYGLSRSADYNGRISSLSIEGTRFSVNGRELQTNLVGEHNVYNVLSAYATVKVCGIDDETIGDALKKITCIPGRFERVGEGRDYHVFVDYAHTPDALDHLLDAANMLKTGRIITVFGCGGDRDKKKRPIMGSIVERKADLAIVTSDNPRTEDPGRIIEDIKTGLKLRNHEVILDRKEAIYRAVQIAKKDDIILIAGKGHEDYQILKDKTIHFDDREVAAEAMKTLRK
jgi:UDP-N-acetylmuramoyl-L-alanyl-D-glutamate--2,6-diaminopimelate ligase